MLKKNQWLWCAEHHKTIKIVGVVVLSALVVMYCYFFLKRFWWDNKIPLQYRPTVSQMEKLNCHTYEVNEMFIPSVNKMVALKGNLSNYVPDPLERGDSRVLLLENYQTTVFGSEILGQRPECLGAFIADKQHWPEPYAILVVDRSSGKTIFRVARLQNYLAR